MLNRRQQSPTPVYYRLQIAIREKIESGYWKPGEMIPPERFFAEEHHLSIGTVKKALTNLVNEGFLYRVQGKGTFVSGTQIRREKVRYYRYCTDFTDQESATSVKLLSLEIIPAVPSINRLLKLRAKDELYHIIRVLNTEGKPRILSVSYLPKKRFKDLDTAPFQARLNSDALYSILEESFSVPTLYNRELIGVGQADRQTAEQLQVPVATLLVVIEMLSFTYKDLPYEYRISYCITDEKKLFREY